MELIWRLPSPGPPLSPVAGREEGTADMVSRGGTGRRAMEAERGRQAGRQATDEDVTPFGLLLPDFVSVISCRIVNVG